MQNLSPPGKLVFGSMRSFVIALCLAGCAAFMPPQTLAGAIQNTANMKMEMSKSLPFLPKPAMLDQTAPGDVGFDPLGLSNIDDLGIDYYWLREAELKHCRLAMLAIAGTLFVDQIGSFPGFPSGKSQPDLFWQVWTEKPTAIGAGIIFIAIIEAISGVAITNGRNGDREPGDFYLDPLNVKADPAKKARYQWSELRNGRLAMFAALGAIVQGLTTHEGAVDNISAIWN